MYLTSNTPMHSRGNKKEIFKDIVIILTLFIFVRIVVFLLFDFSDLLTGDSGYYAEVGNNIVNNFSHGEYSSLSNSIEPTVFRPPLYSAFVGIMTLVVDSPLSVYIYQSVVYFIFAIACYIVLRNEDKKIAFLSVLLIAASPSDALYNGRILSENIVTPLLVMSSIFFIFPKNKTRYFLSGILIGATILVRDVYILLPLLFIIVGLLNGVTSKALFPYVLGFLLVVSPWIVRNINLDENSGAFVSKGIMWSNIWSGSWIEDHNDVIGKNNIPKKALDTLHVAISEGEFYEIWANRANNENFFKDASVHYILNNPIKTVSTWVSRYHLLWIGTRSDLFVTSAERYSLEWYFIKYFLYILNVVVLFFSVVGIFLAIKDRSKLILLVIPIIYSALIYIPFYNIETRYTQPIYPIILIYMTYVLLYLKKLLTKEQV